MILAPQIGIALAPSALEEVLTTGLGKFPQTEVCMDLSSLTRD